MTIDEMTKDELLNELKNVIAAPGRNSMGCSEAYYDSFYMVNEFLNEQEIVAEELSIEEIRRLIRLAGFAAEVFY